ncbi:MAG: D-hexose-6-phosphate mutarotase [Lentisphaeria bacterium]|nr:D-hexose-6-phosphate mutarotase [Lentisphaeria bacterium]
MYIESTIKIIHEEFYLMEITTVNGIESIVVENSFSSAVISLLGGHITSFVPAGKSDLLWMSNKSEFAPGKAIRGGVPVCWPWFGDKAPGLPKHGFVRNEMWYLRSHADLADGSTVVTLEITDRDVKFFKPEFPFTLQMTFYIGKHLEITLTAINEGDVPVEAPVALHTYFSVGDIADVKISGLDKVQFSERVVGADPALQTQHGDIIIDREVDRLYVDTADTVVIRDAERKIIIEKSGSRTCVVWNPWIEKSSKLPDFADGGYRNMVCVEALAAFDDTRVLHPGVPVSITQKITLAE